MKLHQQGNEIIVTQLRPMSDAKQDEWAIYYSKNYYSCEPMLIGRNVVTAANEFIKIEDIEGWLPMPQYRPDAKHIDKTELYEKLRKLDPRQFDFLYRQHLRGEGSFDDLVAKLP